MESDRCRDVFAQMHFHSDTTSRTRDLVTFSQIMCWDFDGEIKWSLHKNLKQRFNLILQYMKWESLQRIGKKKQVHDVSRCNGPVSSSYSFVGRDEELEWCILIFAMSLSTKNKRQMIQVGTSWFVSFNFSYLGYFPSQQFQIDFSVFAATAPVFNDGCVSVSWEGRRKWSFIWIWHPELPNSCPTKSVLIWRRGQKLTLHVCLFGADVAAGVGS